MPRSPLPLLFALLVLLGSAVAQDDAARADALREFQKQWKKFKEEPQMVEAVMTLKGQETPAAAEELLKLLRHPAATVQQAALSVLESYREPATFQAWIDAMPKLKDQEQLALLVKVLGRAKQKGAVPVIEAAAADPKASSVLRYEAARAFAQIGEGGSAGLFAGFLQDKEPQVRLAALDTITTLKKKEHAAATVQALQDPEWHVQTAAVAAVGVLRVQDAIQPLIDKLKEAGRLQIECADSLFKITAVDNGVDAERWQNWWNQCKQITGWRIPTDEELVKKAENRKKYDALYGKVGEGKTNAFAGIPTTSTNVLFIIDVSGSMDDLVVEREKFQGYRDLKRFTIVQTELLNTLDALTPDTNFDILAFATDIDPWKKRLVQANVVNREAAKSWVRALRPLGGSEAQGLAGVGLGGSANLQAGKTNTLKALLYPFGIDPEKPQPKPTITGFDKNATKSPLDTVYFLSDGKPSVGKLVETKEILREVLRCNEAYRIVFHAIAIGDFQKDFLQELARDTGGVFVDLGR